VGTSANHQSSPESQQPINLLLVEDEDLDLLNLRRALRGLGGVASATHASDGLEALEMLREGRVPLTRLVLLMDLNLPRMGGLELLAVLRGTPELADLPVVVLTTSADERDRAEAYRHHVAGYLVKPNGGAAFRARMSAFVAYWQQNLMPERG
jgi:CheY-like chemotaxis protein